MKILLRNFAARVFLTLSLSVLFFLVASPLAHAATWQQPTPEELSMSAAPNAPGANAVYLFREEISDDKLNFHSLYVRIKILTEEGKNTYADVDMPPFIQGHYKIADVQGRTIHSDGTVIPFTGEPIDKLIVKTKDFQYHTTAFTLPDVQVGSILEYRYDLRYDDTLAVPPTWLIQQEVPVLSAHYRFVPTPKMLDTPRGVVEGQIAYSPQLPAGVEVQYLPSSNVYELRMQNIPATVKEDFMPPVEGFSYRVAFYYTAVRTADEYWEEEGKSWSKEIDRFASPSNKIKQAVEQIVQPAGTQEQKVSKIYDAVMTVDNTSFTRSHSAAENKAEGFKIKSAQDIWAQKRGDNDEIALLFVAMVKAAGLKAYAMEVTNRDTAIFRQNYLSMYQLDDDIAIVEIDGKEQFFDPGERYCPFGQMHWKHTLSEGIRQTDQGTALAESSSLNYKQTTVARIAVLTLTADDQLSGSVRLVMSGAEALKWRQAALTSDEDEVKKDFEEELQRNLPPGVEVKMNHFIGLADWKTVLMAMLDVSGSMGTATSKRVFLPSSFFEASSKQLFSHEKRELPVDLHYPYQVTDQVTLTLPATFVAESVPKDAQLSFPKQALYGAKYKADGTTFTAGRQLILADALFDVGEYGQLRDFYQKMNAQDQEQLILKPTAPVAATGAAQ